MTAEVNSLAEGDWIEVVKPAQCGCTNDVGHKYQALAFRVTDYGRCMHCNAVHEPTISVQVTPEVNGGWCGIAYRCVRKCEPPAQLFMAGEAVL